MRKSLMYLIIVGQVLLVWSLVQGIVGTLDSGKRLDELVVKKESLVSRKASLEENMQELKQEYYVEQVARDQLNLVKEGEVIVMIPEEILENEEQGVVPKQNNIPNYVKWWQIIAWE